MAFGFEIEKENYSLFVGFGLPPQIMQTRYYIFDGWVNFEQKKKFFGSIDFWSQEVAAHRTEPKFYGMYIQLTKSTAHEIPGEGTPIGGVFKVIFSNQICNPEKIEIFFKESGIAFHRAEPFIKPVKTLWQVVRGVFSFSTKS